MAASSRGPEMRLFWFAWAAPGAPLVIRLEACSALKRISNATPQHHCLLNRKGDDLFTGITGRSWPIRDRKKPLLSGIQGISEPDDAIQVGQVFCRIS